MSVSLPIFSSLHKQSTPAPTSCENGDAPPPLPLPLATCPPSSSWSLSRESRSAMCFPSAANSFPFSLTKPTRSWRLEMPNMALALCLCVEGIEGEGGREGGRTCQDCWGSIAYGRMMMMMMIKRARQRLGRAGSGAVTGRLLVWSSSSWRCVFLWGGVACCVRWLMKRKTLLHNSLLLASSPCYGSTPP